MAMARAAPSVGSVPAPSSSKRQRESASACFRMETMLVMWEEKVLRLCSMLCSSPISAKNLPEHGKPGPVLGRDMKAGLSHQAEQSRGFQGNRFSARIRPGDDEKVIIPAQTDIDGNGFLFIQ